MSRFLGMLFVGVAAVGLMGVSATPAQAQVGVRIQVGGGYGYQPGYYGSRWNDYHGDRYYRPVRPSYYHDHDDHDHYGHHHHSPRRPTVVVPEYHHWTPDRGYHSHGTILVPHRRHYDAYRY
jgi:hypothetical protein